MVVRCFIFILNHGKIIIGNSSIYAGVLDNIVELQLLSSGSDTDEVTLLDLTKEFVPSITTSSSTGSTYIIFDDFDFTNVDCSYFLISSVFTVTGIDIYDSSARMSYIPPFETGDPITISRSTHVPIIHQVENKYYSSVNAGLLTVIFNKLSGNGSTVKLYITWKLKITGVS